LEVASGNVDFGMKTTGLSIADLNVLAKILMKGGSGLGYGSRISPA